MECLKVKISEKYKPPPKIGLAVTYSLVLSINKEIQNKIPGYDFEREHLALKNIEARRIALSKRFQISQTEGINRGNSTQQRQENGSSVTCENEDKHPGLLQKNRFAEVNSSSNSASPCSNFMLTPIQVSEGFPHRDCNTVTDSTGIGDTSNKTFNISDFETESSPFDNMELESINDIEELAQVLRKSHQNENHVRNTTHLLNNESTQSQFNSSDNLIKPSITGVYYTDRQ